MHKVHVEAREQASGVGSSLLPCDPWDWIQVYLIWANLWLSLLFLKLVYKIIGFHLGFWHLVHFYWFSSPTLTPSPWLIHHCACLASVLILLLCSIVSLILPPSLFSSLAFAHMSPTWLCLFNSQSWDLYIGDNLVGSSFLRRDYLT